MKSYLEYFQSGGTLIPDKYFIELKDWKGLPTGHKMIKNPVFIIAEDFKEVIKNISNKVKRYNDIKTNLPEVNQTSTTITSPSIGTTISLADYWHKNPTKSFSYNIDSNPSSSL